MDMSKSETIIRILQNKGHDSPGNPMTINSLFWLLYSYCRVEKREDMEQLCGAILDGGIVVCDWEKNICQKNTVVGKVKWFFLLNELL
jgi:hypothetical protein